MFSSNQELTVSGRLNQEDLTNALEFAVNMNGILPYNEMTYQILPDNKICLSWSLSEEPDWKHFDFADKYIIAAAIKTVLDKQTVEDTGMDGSYHKGFRMTCLIHASERTYPEIKNPMSKILLFEPFTVFYHK